MRPGRAAVVQPGVVSGEQGTPGLDRVGAVSVAAGLAIAIPTQCFYYYFRSKVDRFVRDTEDLYLEVAAAMDGKPTRTSAATPVDVESGAEAAVHAHS